MTIRQRCFPPLSHHKTRNLMRQVCCHWSRSVYPRAPFHLSDKGIRQISTRSEERPTYQCRLRGNMMDRRSSGRNRSSQKLRRTVRRSRTGRVIRSKGCYVLVGERYSVAYTDHGTHWLVLSTLTPTNSLTIALTIPDTIVS